MLSSKYVEIVVGTGGMSIEDAETVIEEFAQSDFTIVKVEDGENAGETRIIIMFPSVSDAQEFVRAIETIERESIIKFARVVEYSSNDFAGGIVMLGFVAMTSLLGI